MAAKGSILTADFKWFPVLQFYKVRIPEKVPGKGAFYHINHHNLGTFYGLTDSTARHFEAS